MNPRSPRHPRTPCPSRLAWRIEDGTPSPTLTPRQKATLHGLADGLTTTQIAARLGVSAGTVSTLRRRLYQTLEVHTRSEAIAQARRLRLLDAEPRAVSTRPRSASAPSAPPVSSP